MRVVVELCLQFHTCSSEQPSVTHSGQRRASARQQPSKADGQRHLLPDCSPLSSPTWSHLLSFLALSLIILQQAHSSHLVVVVVVVVFFLLLSSSSPSTSIHAQRSPRRPSPPPHSTTSLGLFPHTLKPPPVHSFFVVLSFLRQRSGGPPLVDCISLSRRPKAVRARRCTTHSPRQARTHLARASYLHPLG